MKNNQLKISVILNKVVILSMMVSLMVNMYSLNDGYSASYWIYLSVFSLFLLMISFSLGFFVLLDRLVTDKSMLVMGLFHLLFNLFGIITYALVVTYVNEHFLHSIILLISIVVLFITSFFYYKKYDELTNF